MITEIKDTNLIAVEVPTDASDYRILNNILLNFESVDTNLIFLHSKCDKILGETTKDKIGFDCEFYVEKYAWEDSPDYGEKYAYRDYVDGEETDNYWDMYPFDVDEINKSFYSRLAANGIYFENPLGYPQFDIKNESDFNEVADFHTKWQSYEDKIVKGKLLIIEKI